MIQIIKFTEIRCTRCNLNNMIVITEESYNLSKYIYYDKIIEVKYEEIIDKTIEVYKIMMIIIKNYLINLFI